MIFQKWKKDKNYKCTLVQQYLKPFWCAFYLHFLLILVFLIQSLLQFFFQAKEELIRAVFTDINSESWVRWIHHLIFARTVITWFVWLTPNVRYKQPCDIVLPSEIWAKVCRRYPVMFFFLLKTDTYLKSLHTVRDSKHDILEKVRLWR